MAIGDYYYVHLQNKLARLICKLLGGVDLHTYLRLSPMIKFIKKYLSNCCVTNLTVLELGCGSGVNGFELEKLTRKKRVRLSYTGVDLASASISRAKLTLSALPDRDIRAASLSFCSEDAISYAESKYSGPKIDIILLIDVIEHIQEPQRLLNQLKRYLKPDGLFIVSVPTPLYPKIFGRAFHLAVGHCVDGYTMPCLDALFSAISCPRTVSRYNTGLFASVGCWLFYNLITINNKYVYYFKSILLYPFRYLDIFNGSKLSASLFAVYSNRSK